MPTVKGVKYPYTPKGRKAAARARNEAGTSTYDDIKTKSDMMASNIASTIKNMGYQGGRGGGASPPPTGKGIGNGNKVYGYTAKFKK